MICLAEVTPKLFRKDFHSLPSTVLLEAYSNLNILEGYYGVGYMQGRP